MAVTRATSMAVDEGYNAITGTDQGLPDPIKDYATDYLKEKFNLTDEQAKIVRKVMPGLWDMVGKAARTRMDMGDVIDFKKAKKAIGEVLEKRGKEYSDNLETFPGKFRSPESQKWVDRKLRDVRVKEIIDEFDGMKYGDTEARSKVWPYRELPMVSSKKENLRPVPSLSNSWEDLARTWETSKKVPPADEFLSPAEYEHFKEFVKQAKGSDLFDYLEKLQESLKGENRDIKNRAAIKKIVEQLKKQTTSQLGMQNTVPLLKEPKR